MHATQHHLAERGRPWLGSFDLSELLLDIIRRRPIDLIVRDNVQPGRKRVDLENLFDFAKDETFSGVIWTHEYRDAFHRKNHLPCFRKVESHGVQHAIDLSGP